MIWGRRIDHEDLVKMDQETINWRRNSIRICARIFIHSKPYACRETIILFFSCPSRVDWYWLNVPWESEIDEVFCFMDRVADIIRNQFMLDRVRILFDISKVRPKLIFQAICRTKSIVSNQLCSPIFYFILDLNGFWKTNHSIVESKFSYASNESKSSITTTNAETPRRVFLH